MKKFTLAACALLGYTSALKSQCYPYGGGLTNADDNGECIPHRVQYDYSCRNERLNTALDNPIDMYGPNVELLNLDNHCEVERIEREGVFLQTGDLLFVTGREFSCALQQWEEPYWSVLDYDVLFPGLDYDMPLVSAPGHRQEIVVLEAVGSGKTAYEIDLSWGNEIVREVEIVVYVDQQPGLVATTPRHSCDCDCERHVGDYY